MLNDLRYSLRSLFRSPGFALAAILTLALGIGANTAIFSVADAVLLRPLPYPDSSRLVMVWDQLQKLGLDRLAPRSDTAEAYRNLSNIFEMSGGIYPLDRILTGDGGAERVPAMLVSKDVFAMLAPRTTQGRIFTDDEYRANAASVAILSHSFFLRHFAGDPSALSKSITLDGRPHRIVGVMSPAFDFSLRGTGTDVWTPKSLDTPRSWGNATRMIARLKPGVSIEAAQSALTAAAQHVDETNHPYTGPHGEDAGYRVKVISLHDQLLGEFRTVTLILLCAVAAVLLIACVNVANLLLVRAVAREKETTVRRALGATSARLIGQWMTESAVLALLGGALGSMAAVWGVKLLTRLSPAALPGTAKISVDGRALAFTVAVSAIVCFLFGLAPALASTKLSWGTRGATRRSRRAASSLITIEVALAVMLMIGAGLLLKSFSRLSHVNPGFNPSHLLTMQVQFPATVPFSKVRIRSFYSDLRDKLAALPGVTSATFGFLPVRGPNVNAGGGDPFQIKGRPYGSSGPVGQFANLSLTGIDYFRTFQIPLREGRAFEPSDAADAPPVVLVNETMARAFFPQGAIGQQLGVPTPCTGSTCEPTWSTIIGVASDVKTFTLDRAPLPQIYIPLSQYPFPGATVALRTVGDPLPLTREVAAIVRSLDPDMPVFDVKTMEDRVSESIGQPRFETAIVAFFAAAALFLAAIGIFGVVAHSTAQRTQEIGIRMALGADGPRVVRTILLDGLRPVLSGVLLGLAGALALSRILATTLFNVKATDPTTFLIAALVLTAVAVAACLVPASRATKVDPVIALREQV
jgi:putative ABC transport system permease protein